MGEQGGEVGGRDKGAEEGEVEGGGEPGPAGNLNVASQGPRLRRLGSWLCPHPAPRTSKSWVVHPQKMSALSPSSG